MADCLKCKFLVIEVLGKNYEIGTCQNPPQDLKMSQEVGGYAYLKKPGFYYNYGKQINCPNFIDKNKI